MASLRSGIEVFREFCILAWYTLPPARAAASLLDPDLNAHPRSPTSIGSACAEWPIVIFAPD